MLAVPIAQPQRRRSQHVAVIGAGSSGLSTVKSLLEEGHSVICYEQESVIGGNWAYSEEKGKSSIYESSVIFSTKENMCYSDFPPSPELPYYLHHSHVLDYLNSYADHFKLRDHIRFNTRVLKISPIGDGSWEITSEQDDMTSVDIFDAVMVCNGHHRIPKMANFEGADEFVNNGGILLHSHSYNHPRDFVNKRVVVVGAGNSGCDLAAELAQVAKQAYMSTRHGLYIIPKYYWGIPTDHLFLNRFFTSLPKFIRKFFFEAFTWLVQGSMKRYGVPCNLKKGQHPTRNQEILSRIKEKKLIIKPDIKKLSKGKVQFEDGSEIDVDAVIYATGYRISFPFLEGVFHVSKKNEVRLFKFVVPPDPLLKNLYFVGLVQPAGALMPIAELQGRWIARVLSDEVKLPSPIEMERDIQNKRKFIEENYHKSSRHTIQVDYIGYMDELADLIGAKPKLYRHWKILIPLLFGVITPFQYRLDGPGRLHNASDIIKQVYYTKPNVTFMSSSPKMTSSSVAQVRKTPETTESLYR